MPIPSGAIARPAPKETRGSRAFAEIYGSSAARVQLEGKDPRGWREFVDQLGEHSPLGAANTMRGVQAKRPSLYGLEERFRGLEVPTLIIAGDEDDNSLQPSLMLKRAIPACGLLVLPKTGHTINLEEPAAFNQAVADFLAQVAAGRQALDLRRELRGFFVAQRGDARLRLFRRDSMSLKLPLNFGAIDQTEQRATVRQRRNHRRLRRGGEANCDEHHEQSFDHRYDLLVALT